MPLYDLEQDPRLRRMVAIAARWEAEDWTRLVQVVRLVGEQIFADEATHSDSLKEAYPRLRPFLEAALARESLKPDVGLSRASLKSYANNLVPAAMAVLGFGTNPPEGTPNQRAARRILETFNGQLDELA